MINKAVRDAFAPEVDAYVDPLDRLRRDSRRDKLFLDGLHYTDYGHGVIARLLEPKIARLLPPVAPGQPALN